MGRRKYEGKQKLCHNNLGDVKWASAYAHTYATGRSNVCSRVARAL
jgi:hypothetical protein